MQKNFNIQFQVHKTNKRKKNNISTLQPCNIPTKTTIFAISKTVDVAQLVRASVCGTEGRGFEPHHLPSRFIRLTKFLKLRKSDLLINESYGKSYYTKRQFR